MLTGQIKSFDDIPENDIRRVLPRFQPENFENNIKLVKELEKDCPEEVHSNSAGLGLAPKSIEKGGNARNYRYPRSHDRWSL